MPLIAHKPGCNRKALRRTADQTASQGVARQRVRQEAEGGGQAASLVVRLWTGLGQATDQTAATLCDSLSGGFVFNAHAALRFQQRCLARPAAHPGSAVAAAAVQAIPRRLCLLAAIRDGALHPKLLLPAGLKGASALGKVVAGLTAAKLIATSDADMLITD